jgi:hypothetical protein
MSGDCSEGLVVNQDVARTRFLCTGFLPVAKPLPVHKKRVQATKLL